MGIAESLAKAAQRKLEEAARSATSSNGPNRLPSINLPGVPDIKGGWDRAKGVLEGEPDYLVSHKKSKGAETVYRGDVQKDGNVKFREVGQDELIQLRQKDIVPETFQQLKAKVAAGNTPGTLTTSLSRAQAADEILVRVGKGKIAEDNSVDHLSADLAKKGKGVDVAGNVSAGREELIQEFEQRKKELDDLLKPEKGKKKLDQDKPFPGEPEGGITPRQLKDSIEGELKALKEAQEPGKAAKAFDSQVVNPTTAPAPGNPLDGGRPAPAAAPSNPLDRGPG